MVYNPPQMTLLPLANTSTHTTRRGFANRPFFGVNPAFLVFCARGKFDSMVTGSEVGAKCSQITDKERRDVSNARVKTLKLVKLNEVQDVRWGQLMGIAWGMGLNDEQAASEAWDGLCEEWPELKQYDGAE